MGRVITTQNCRYTHRTDFIMGQALMTGQNEHDNNDFDAKFAGSFAFCLESIFPDWVGGKKQKVIGKFVRFDEVKQLMAMVDLYNKEIRRRKRKKK